MSETKRYYCERCNREMHSNKKNCVYNYSICEKCLNRCVHTSCIDCVMYFRTFVQGEENE